MLFHGRNLSEQSFYTAIEYIKKELKKPIIDVGEQHLKKVAILRGEIERKQQELDKFISNN